MGTMYPLSAPRLEIDLQRCAVLLEMADVLSRHHEPSDLFRGLAPSLRAVVPFDFLHFALHDPSQNLMKLYVWDGAEWPNRPLEVSIDDSVVGRVWKYRQAVTIDDLEREAIFHSGLAWLRDYQLSSYTVLPLSTPNSNLGALGFGSKRPHAFSARQVRYLQRVAEIVALCVDRRQVLATFAEERERVRLLLANAGGLSIGDFPVLGSDVAAPGSSIAPANDTGQDFAHPISFALPEGLDDPEQLIDAYFRGSTVGLCILDSDLRYLAINSALAEMNGIPAQTHLGKTPHEVLGEIAKTFDPHFQRVLSTGQSVLNFELSAALPARSEINHWVEHFFPIKGADGKVNRIAVVAVETSKQKKLEESFRTLTATLKKEKERLFVLLELSRVLEGNWDVPRLFPRISALLRRVLRHEFAAFGLYDEEKRVFVRRALDFPLGKGVFSAATPITSGGPQGRAVAERQAVTFSQEDIARFRAEPSMAGIADSYLGEGLKSLCCVPLLRPSGTVGALSLASTRSDAFQPEDLALLNQVGAQLAIALENSHASRQIHELKNRLAEEKKYLEGEIRTELNFEEIVGESPALRHVLQQVATVATSDATVLVLGETGTGKELIARALHRMSGRKDRGFIKLNCAAIPTGLLESELFGHEKGAFTGAVSQKVGRLELADHGTLFLDEVGEIPLELQPKLLRVLQDHEFERLGGTRTIKVNLRLIAATNRDLARSVSEGQFRSDLFYRLNVFPVRMPPLRDRREDIPMLVHYFVQKYALRMGRHIETIPKETMNALINCDWPGNVRELENFMERSVILSEGPALRVPLSELLAADRTTAADHTLENAERAHIIRVLRQTGGVISGPAGAARRLGVKRTTLQSKIQRLKITSEDYSSPKQS
jgi:formate hydrogenlyase transcriptional activator